MATSIHSAAGAAGGRTAISHSRLIAACTIGNALEFYDFVVFSFFARTIGAIFFPAQDPSAQLLLTFATYGVGFFLRPLGGLVIGAYADRKGRKKATVLTLMMMALGTGMIGLAPTYATVGIAAPLLIVLGRLIQGFSAGGEVGASTTLLAEYSPRDRRGFFGSWQLASQGLAVMAAAATALVINISLPPEAVASWGWRIAFLIGVLIVPIGLWLRRALEETHANEDNVRTRQVSSLNLVFRDHWGKILSGVGLIIGGTASSAIIGLYMATYAVTQLKLAPASGLLAGVVAGLCTLIAAPIGGILSDRIGRRPVAFFCYLVLFILIYPAFLYLNANPTLATLLLVVGALMSLNAMGGAPVLITLAEIFPAEVRATGMSLVYALGVAIFGGFGQFIVTGLIATTGNPLAPAYYVMACTIVSVFALRTIPETKGKALD
jgi:MFS transporter, MHS family, proline/betaine transporter